MNRRIAASLSALAMLLVLAVPVLAGGWADIKPDAQTSTSREGTPTEIGFTVLQHGVTPAPWETATVRFTDAATGDSFDVAAANDRSDGHFVASATLPHAGYWSWQVTLGSLASEQVPVRITVLTASGGLPPFDPSSLLAAIDRTKLELTSTMDARIGTEVGRLQRQDDGYAASIDRLEAQSGALVAERDRLAARIQTLEGVGGLPLIAVISLAVLAGSAAGFAMAWLAGQTGRRREGPVVIDPVRRGVDAV
ncbi:MAG TPA: hypothetical protein VFI69_07040 [Candidatus Limnocylindrales bacterium]|nr:hypothetical protein [Candidatus Limnocylindrales bacterium]